jgi:hypothetical protein
MTEKTVLLLQVLICGNSQSWQKFLRNFVQISTVPLKQVYFIVPCWMLP